MKKKPFIAHTDGRKRRRKRQGEQPQDLGAEPTPLLQPAPVIDLGLEPETPLTEPVIDLGPEPEVEI